MIPTPCIKICVMDGKLCIGCGRTLDEIARWGAMAETEQRALMAVLPWRVAALGRGKQPDEKADAVETRKRA